MDKKSKRYRKCSVISIVISSLILRSAIGSVVGRTIFYSISFAQSSILTNHINMNVHYDLNLSFFLNARKNVVNIIILSHTICSKLKSHQPYTHF
jgi:hypothetical protein